MFKVSTCLYLKTPTNEKFLKALNNERKKKISFELKFNKKIFFKKCFFYAYLISFNCILIHYYLQLAATPLGALKGGGESTSPILSILVFKRNRKKIGGGVIFFHDDFSWECGGTLIRNFNVGKKEPYRSSG